MRMPIDGYPVELFIDEEGRIVQEININDQMLRMYMSSEQALYFAAFLEVLGKFSKEQKEKNDGNIW